MNEMENQRIAEELQRQHLAQHHSQRSCSQCVPLNRHSKDSGVVDVDMLRAGVDGGNRLSAPECVGGASGKKNALSNSLIDLAQGESRSVPPSCSVVKLVKMLRSLRCSHASRQWRKSRQRHGVGGSRQSRRQQCIAARLHADVISAKRDVTVGQCADCRAAEGWTLWWRTRESRENAQLKQY